MTEPSGPITFFSRTYDETLGLLVEARDYVGHGQVDEIDDLGPTAQALAAQETTRLVARLTQIMAWLLVRKAVTTGEMTADEALRGEHRLAGHAICLDDGPVPRVMPDTYLATLMDRSRRLYVRVARLDEMLERAA